MNFQELFELLLRATPAITLVFLFTLLIMLTLRWLKKPHPQSSQEKSPANNLYDRIHNYQYTQPAKTSRTHSRSHSQNNTSTDSNYHHAIKLLQRGTDIKTLVEYCNLTQGEAELLHAVYAKKA